MSTRNRTQQNQITQLLEVVADLRRQQEGMRIQNEELRRHLEELRFGRVQEHDPRSSKQS